MPHILITDDERYQRLLLRELLAGDSSLTFGEASDGQQALDQARIHRPDLVLLDVMMPILDGLEACRRFKTDPELQAIPVLLVTAWRPAPTDRQIWQATGADGMIHRPFEDGQLQATVAAFLHPSDN